MKTCLHPCTHFWTVKERHLSHLDTQCAGSQSKRCVCQNTAMLIPSGRACHIRNRKRPQQLMSLTINSSSTVGIIPNEAWASMVGFALNVTFRLFFSNMQRLFEGDFAALFFVIQSKNNIQIVIKSFKFNSSWLYVVPAC